MRAAIKAPVAHAEKPKLRRPHRAARTVRVPELVSRQQRDRSREPWRRRRRTEEHRGGCKSGSDVHHRGA
jgi:hypothetical protein